MGLSEIAFNRPASIVVLRKMTRLISALVQVADQL